MAAGFMALSEPGGLGREQEGLYYGRIAAPDHTPRRFDDVQVARTMAGELRRSIRGRCARGVGRRDSHQRREIAA
jgi:hypothetical protein